jgi:hypothetical protein
LVIVDFPGSTLERMDERKVRCGTSISPILPAKRPAPWRAGAASGALGIDEISVPGTRT